MSSWDTAGLTVLMCVAWQALFLGFHILLHSKQLKDALSPSFPAHLAPSYFVSLVHATVVSVRGLQMFVALLDAPPDVMFSAGLTLYSDPRISTVERTACVFMAYLVYDLIHVSVSYPKLGGMDMILHHLAFLMAALLSLHYHMLHFPFCWLVLAEMSTVFLNLRWFAIKALSEPHQRDFQQRVLSFLNVLLAVTFGLTRVIVYGVGLAHLALHLDYIQAPPRFVAIGVFVLLVAGYCLNILWFRKIIMIWNKTRRVGNSKTEAREAPKPSAQLNGVIRTHDFTPASKKAS
mmetsp:Transcript_13491/g.29240  ORF Transcript_13491/g.29240 Transcript_13491/m.29240 type:complete len:291 (+) Transcript_13491:155-1027(+)